MTHCSRKWAHAIWAAPFYSPPLTRFDLLPPPAKSKKNMGKNANVYGRSIGQTRLILLLVFHVLVFKDSSDMVKKCDWGQKVENQAQLGTKSPF